jgi:hypothetical protein
MNGGILIMDNGQVMLVGSPNRFDIIISAMEVVIGELIKKEKERVLQMAEEIKSQEQKKEG